MWLVYWLQDRWERVQSLFDSWWYDVKDVTYHWYDIIRWLVVTSYTALTNVLYYWYSQIAWLIEDVWENLDDVIYWWYSQIKWICTSVWEYFINIVYYWYSYIEDLAYWWYSQIKWICTSVWEYFINIVYNWYHNIADLAYWWYSQIKDLVGSASNLLYLAITIIQKIKDVFSTTWWDDLAAFLSNPGAYVWSYIIGLAEDKLEELLDAHW